MIERISRSKEIGVMKNIMLNPSTSSTSHSHNANEGSRPDMANASAEGPPIVRLNNHGACQDHYSGSIMPPRHRLGKVRRGSMITVAVND